MSETFQQPKLRYQWYVGYDRAEEYEKNPQWAIDMRADVEPADEEEPYQADSTRMYDKYDPEHMWIKSDQAVDLTDCL